MPVKGQILEDTQSGDTYEFLETAADSAGDRVVVKHRIRSSGKRVPNHSHAFQSEAFEVISGTLTYVRNGKQASAKAGERVSFKPGEVHNHFNLYSEPLEMIHTTEPALDFEYLLENLVGLSCDGKIKNGKVDLLQSLVSQKTMESKAYLAFPPPAVQKVLGLLLAPVGRLFGYRAVYAKYSGFEK